MAVEIPLEVTADTDPVKEMVSELENMKSALKADKRAIEDLKATIATLKDLGVHPEILDAAKNKLKDLEKQYVHFSRTVEDKSSSLAAIKEQAKAEQEAANKTDKAQGDAHKSSLERLKGLLGMGQAAGGKLGEISGKGSQLIEVFGKLGQGAEGSSGGIGKLTEALGKNGGKVAVVIAVVLALVYAIKAAVTAIIDFTKHAITASDAARTLAITAVATFKGKSGAVEWAKEVSILGDKTDLSKEKLQEMGLSLKKFKGDEFISAFHAIAVATSALGEEGGGQIKSFVEKIKEGAEAAKSTKFQFKADDFKDLPITVEELADSLGKLRGTSSADALKALKDNTVEVSEALLAVRTATDAAYGDAAQAKAKSFQSLSAKLSENWDKLFSGADLRVILHALDRLVGLLDESSASGSTLKDVIGTVAQFFVDIAGGAIITIADILEGILILGYDIYNVWLDIQLAIEDARDALDGMMNFEGIDLSQIGVDAVNGLITGIKSKVGDAVSAVRDLGLSIKDAFKAVLDIHSPSKVFEELGLNVAEGAAQGIDAGAPMVEASAEDMLPIPDANAGAASAPASITNIFNIAGENAQEIADVVKIEIMRVFQGSLISRGIDPEEAAP